MILTFHLSDPLVSRKCLLSFTQGLNLSKAGVTFGHLVVRQSLFPINGKGILDHPSRAQIVFGLKGVDKFPEKLDVARHHRHTSRMLCKPIRHFKHENKRRLRHFLQCTQCIHREANIARSRGNLFPNQIGNLFDKAGKAETGDEGADMPLIMLNFTESTR
jgi:hypothetical protein